MPAPPPVPLCPPLWGLPRSRWAPGLASLTVCLTSESMAVFAALFFSMTFWKLSLWYSITRQRNREEICWGHSPLAGSHLDPLARCRVPAPGSPGLGPPGPSPLQDLPPPGHHQRWLRQHCPHPPGWTRPITSGSPLLPHPLGSPLPPHPSCLHEAPWAFLKGAYVHHGTCRSQRLGPWHLRPLGLS